MSTHWKAMYPTLSVGGNCIAQSTPDLSKGWFYDTYKGAEEGTNKFAIFKCDFKEHPEYNNVDWVMNMIGTLGYERFLTEFDMKFID